MNTPIPNPLENLRLNQRRYAIPYLLATLKAANNEPLDQEEKDAVEFYRLLREFLADSRDSQKGKIK